MDYLTIREVAERWGVSERLVQKLCIQQRVEGAIKLDGKWAIPGDAKKPTDPRKGKPRPQPRIQETHPKALSHHARPMPLLNTSFASGHCMATINAILDPEERSIALCEYYYFSGQPERAAAIAEHYLDHQDLALRMSACWLYGYANLALNRTEQVSKVMARIQNALESLDESTPQELQALTVCIATGAAVLLHLPLAENYPSLKSHVSCLPTGLQLFALYVQAHHTYLAGRYGISVGIAETGLLMENNRYPIAAIYLHLVATMSYMALKQPRAAREHLLAAWELAKPDGLIEAFGEHHGLLGGMLEATLKKDWPEDFRRIIDITYHFSAGWRQVHNLHTGHDVANDLTTTEFSIAMLASRGWTNSEISEHLGISVNTVKRHTSAILRKLGVSDRHELTKFMLQ